MVLTQTGKPAEAEAEFRQALAIYQKLADDNPAVTGFRGSLGDNHYNLGVLLSITGRAAEAEAEHRKALAIHQKLADDNPRIPGYRRSMTRCLNNIGDLLTDAGRATEAIQFFMRSRNILEALVEENSAVEDFRNGLAFSLSGLGRARRRAGDRTAAVADLRRAIALRERLAGLDFEARYNLACNHALLAALAAENGSDLGPADARAQADKAIELLKRVVADGYRNAKMKTEPDLDPLRGRLDFQLLMLDLDFPADPFATAQ